MMSLVNFFIHLMIISSHDKVSHTFFIKIPNFLPSFNILKKFLILSLRLFLNSPCPTQGVNSPQDKRKI